MIETQKILTLEETLQEMKKLKFRLIALAERLNIRNIGISAVNYKDIKISSSPNGDIILLKIIKRTDTMSEFEEVKRAYNDYKELAGAKIADIISKKSKAYCIAYFRDTLEWKWEDIAKMFNYSKRHCIRLYKEFKKLPNLA